MPSSINTAQEEYPDNESVVSLSNEGATFNDALNILSQLINADRKFQALEARLKALEEINLQQQTQIAGLSEDRDRFALKAQQLQQSFEICLEENKQLKERLEGEVEQAAALRVATNMELQTKLEAQKQELTSKIDEKSTVSERKTLLFQAQITTTQQQHKQELLASVEQHKTTLQAQIVPLREETDLLLKERQKRIDPEAAASLHPRCHRRGWD